MQHQSSHHGSSNSNNDGGSSGFSKTWELNQYELNRLPHEIIYDDRAIAVSPKVLQNELMCPICLDILKHTMTTKECLHRFCQECIITALRAGNKECPTCRKKLISKRSLRPDPNFDSIIAKIYPNREEYDALHEKVLEKLNKKHLTSQGVVPGATGSDSRSNRRNTVNRGLSQSNGTSTRDQIESHSNAQMASTSNGKGVKRSNTNVSVTVTSATAAISENDSDLESRTSTEQSSTHCAFQQDTDEIELVLKPHPVKELILTSKRFLKTTSNATMNHLSKYLWTRLCVEAAASETTDQVAASTSTDASAETEFQLFIHHTRNTYHLLDPTLTLEQVIEQYWKQNRPIELFYHHFGNFSHPKSKKSANTTISLSHLNDINTNSNSSSSSSSCSNSSGRSNSCRK